MSWEQRRRLGEMTPISPVFTPQPSRPLLDEKMLVEVLREILLDVVRLTAEETVEDMTMLMAEDFLFALVDEYSTEVEEEFMKDLKDLVLSSSEASSTASEIPTDHKIQNIFDGRLTQQQINDGLSRLSHSASGQELVYLDLFLPDLELIDVSILSNYSFIQNIDISNNKITDLSWVSYMPNLLQLNAFQNELTSFFKFKPPKYLKKRLLQHHVAPKVTKEEVDFSYNNISEMEDLSAFQFLSKLILDSNQISEIKGLKNCSSLIYLSLAHNNISEMTGLEDLPIVFLSLRDNYLTDIMKLVKLNALQQIDLSKNKISCLLGLQDHDLLQVINLEDNQISELNELNHIENLPYVEVLNLLNNPIQDNPDYWLTALYKAPKLTELDRKKVKITDKVAAVNKYNPPPEVVAARDHRTHVVNYFLRPQKISDSTLLSLDMPYPVLVLTGPQTSGKRELAQILCQEFSNFFGYWKARRFFLMQQVSTIWNALLKRAVEADSMIAFKRELDISMKIASACHTTRKPHIGEKEGSDYYFVSKKIFEDMIHEGQFIETIKYNGHYYGLSRDALEAVAREGLGCCINMELEGVRSLKKTYLEPRYILLIPMDKQEYTRRLWQSGVNRKTEAEVATSRIDTYIKMNQDHPGYFDAVINTTDLVEAYTQLRHLLREYLNFTDQTSSDSDRTATGDKKQTSESLKITPDKEKELSIDAQLNQNKIGPFDFSDSASRNYSSRVQARLSADKTSMEKDSLERREQVAREAVQGKTPNASIHLFHRAPNISTYMHSLDEQLSDTLFLTSMMPNTSNITRSQYLMNVGDDKSVEDSQTASDVTTLSSAEIFIDQADSASASGSVYVEQLIPGMDILDLFESRHTESNRVFDIDATDTAAIGDLEDVRQSESDTTESGAISSHSFRIGVNIKPVLPPIPSGWKRETPGEPGICLSLK